MRCGQLQETRVHRKIIGNSHDLFRETKQVEKALFEIAGKAGNEDMASIMIRLLNANIEAMRLNQGVPYTLLDLEQEDVLTRAAVITHSHFTGNAFVALEEGDIHIKYDALGPAARKMLWEKMSLTKEQKSNLRPLALVTTGPSVKRQRSPEPATSSKKAKLGRKVGKGRH